MFLTMVIDINTPIKFYSFLANSQQSTNDPPRVQFSCTQEQLQVCILMVCALLYCVLALGPCVEIEGCNKDFGQVHTTIATALASCILRLIWCLNEDSRRNQT